MGEVEEFEVTVDAVINARKRVNRLESNVEGIEKKLKRLDHILHSPDLMKLKDEIDEVL